jgi:IS605 OrfB family transposase
MKTITITRKVTLHFDTEDKDKLKQYYDRISNWAYITRKSANIVSSHQFYQKNQMIIEKYFDPDFAGILSDRNKSENGVLQTSLNNTTYRVISDYYKGQMPMASLSALNNLVVNTLKKNIGDILKGVRSLQSYRNNLPVQLPKKFIYNLRYNAKSKNFHFNAFSNNADSDMYLPFKTHLGRDRSDNKTVINRALDGKYKICDSSIMLYRSAHTRKTKIFLLLVVSIPAQEYDPVPGRVLSMNLGMMHPVAVCHSDTNYTFHIGNAEEFLHKRKQLQEGLQRQQKAARYNKSGKGRAHKLAVLNRFKQKEQNYINTKNHQYSKMVVDYAAKQQCEFIIIENFEGINQEKIINHEEHPEADYAKRVIRNWSYFQLQEFIKYKAKKYGIKVMRHTPAYMSQKCVKCGHTIAENRIGTQKFTCTNCGHSDLSDNIHAWNMSRIDLKSKELELI